MKHLIYMIECWWIGKKLSFLLWIAKNSVKHPRTVTLLCYILGDKRTPFVTGFLILWVSLHFIIGSMS